jgi:hypothetical protein
MQPNILKSTPTKAHWLVIHPLSQEDSVTVTTLRSIVATMKGKLEGTAARGQFDGIMERVAVPEGATFEAEPGSPGQVAKLLAGVFATSSNFEMAE